MKLLETIRFNLGKFSNIELHQHRMNDSRKRLFNCNDEIDIVSILSKYVKDLPNNQVLKCRVIYSIESASVEFIHYKPPNITSLKLVNCNEIEYSHKYLDRSHINKLLLQKGSADDIIIVKNGLVTDSSFANLLYFNGEKWLTPAFPLLKGTQRAKLLELDKIFTADIRPSDLSNFTKIRLVNAMLRFEDEVDIMIDKILL